MSDTIQYHDIEGISLAEILDIIKEGQDKPIYDTIEYLDPFRLISDIDMPKNGKLTMKDNNIDRENTIFIRFESKNDSSRYYQMNMIFDNTYSWGKDWYEDLENNKFCFGLGTQFRDPKKTYALTSYPLHLSGYLRCLPKESNDSYTVRGAITSSFEEFLIGGYANFVTSVYASTLDYEGMNITAKQFSILEEYGLNRVINTFINNNEKFIVKSNVPIFFEKAVNTNVTWYDGVGICTSLYWQDYKDKNLLKLLNDFDDIHYTTDALYTPIQQSFLNGGNTRNKLEYDLYYRMAYGSVFNRNKIKGYN